METVELFREYQVAVDEERIAYERYGRRVNLLGRGNPRTQAAADRHTCRERQRDKLAARILDDLADDGWTRVTDDPTTLSMRGITVLGAWINGTNTRIVCASSWDGRRWCSDGMPSPLVGWRLYAWQEWPLAPPLPD